MNELINMGGKRCKKGISDISEGFNDALRLAANGDEAKAYTLLLDVVKMSEKSACNLRELVGRYGYPEEQEELEQIVLGSHPVDIGFTEEGWFVVRMDPLAKTKALASKPYIRGIIAPAMRRFFADKPNVRYPKCVLIFRHMYDRNFPVRYMRDYDNVEVKQVTDKDGYTPEQIRYACHRKIRRDYEARMAAQRAEAEAEAEANEIPEVRITSKVVIK